MPSTKGRTNNKSGRPKGAKNKRTIQWEELGEYITTGCAERAMKYLNSIEDEKEFYEKYLLILNYFKPRMQSAHLEANVGVNKEDLQKIFPSAEDLQQEFPTSDK